MLYITLHHIAVTKLIYSGALILYGINKGEILCCYDRSVHFLQNKYVEKFNKMDNVRIK